ncbi:uncharacterized protein LOC129741817 [Uranotaenia lowii]|uniref:uncharacterized protein LOC129741817 n=1 Tax=Uranotaenia lowii TaxID=190385 RepID=UPI002478806B|nr:uncharacterized protein LOC129741817 [Uranotaenia lowii]
MIFNLTISFIRFILVEKCAIFASLFRFETFCKWDSLARVDHHPSILCGDFDNANCGALRLNGPLLTDLLDLFDVDYPDKLRWPSLQKSPGNLPSAAPEAVERCRHGGGSHSAIDDDGWNGIRLERFPVDSRFKDVKAAARTGKRPTIGIMRHWQRAGASLTTHHLRRHRSRTGNQIEVPGSHATDL